MDEDLQAVIQELNQTLFYEDNDSEETPSPINEISTSSNVVDPFTAIDNAIAEYNALNQFQDLINQIPPRSETSEPSILNNPQTETVSPLNNTVRLLESQADSLQNTQSEPSEPNQQDGGKITQNATQQESSSSLRVVRRDRFNNIEISQPLNIRRDHGFANYAAYYSSVMDNLQGIAQMAFQHAGRHDVVQLELRGDGLPNSSSVILTGEAHDLNELKSLTKDIVQSNKDVSADSDLILVAQVIRNPRGGGKKRKLANTLDNEILKKKKRFLRVVDNGPDNQLCFAINLAHLLYPNITDSEAFLRGRDIQKTAGLTDQTAVTFNDIPKFERALKCKIVVLYRTDDKKTHSKFVTDTPRSQKTLYMFLFENHYYGVIDVKAFLGTQYACNYCYTGYNNVLTHRCRGHCNVCLDPSCTKQELQPVVCPDCNRTCRSPSCLTKHKEPTERVRAQKYISNCELRKKCKECKMSYYIAMNGKNEPHKCLSLRCKICGEFVDSEKENEAHRCYIQPLPKSEEHTEKLIFYDFETYVDSSGVHVPFLVCTKTLDGKRWNARGADCAERFIMHFRQPSYKKSIFIAHNAKGFDSYIVINAMVALKMKPSLIMQGSKVICFTDADYQHKYIDSLSFLNMRLSAMPKALGFADKTKGFFPHRFSSENRLNYVGPYPPPEAYGTVQMMKEERREFDTWYETVRHGKFDFEKEAIRYCQNDVDILSEACCIFRKGYIDETGVDPFSCVTIASACMKVFCTNFLRPKTLAIPSPDNYRRQFKSFSNSSIQWIEWEAHTDNIFIQHALNAGEKQIGRYYVDGYAEVQGVKCAWEFLGCFYHGCPSCFQPDETCSLTGRPFKELNAAWEDKLQTLQSVHGIKVIVMREHHWVEMKKKHQGLKEFLEHYKAPQPLLPRDALYGGRTSAVRLRYTAAPDETVQYVDVTSLYPYVNCTFPYPLGHPKIIYTDFQEPQSYFGIIRAVVYPPRGLFFPVLPYRTAAGKLVFTLCRTCAELNFQEGACTHDDHARALTGVWVTPEFNKALEMGYRLGRITEVWHFDQQSDSIFVKYMHTFLKGKQEASGYPPEATDQESREKYIRDYETNQGILLDADKIKPNPAKRQVSKLCLNSFWGKFAQRSNLNQTALITEPEEFFSYMFSEKYKVKYFSFLNDTTALVQWSHSDRYIAPPNKVDNVFIAAFTTAYGRLKLYSYLEQMHERVLYYDTDSLIYVTKEGEPQLKLGNYLGDLTDELGGDSIQDFAAAGPKSYAYQTKKKRVVLRVKGITQTHEFCERVNFDSIKELVEGYEQNRTAEGVIETPQHNIVRDKKGFLLKNSSFQKKFRVVFDKRRLLSTGQTLPFGY